MACFLNFRRWLLAGVALGTLTGITGCDALNQLTQVENHQAGPARSRASGGYLNQDRPVPVTAASMPDQEPEDNVLLSSKASKSDLLVEVRRLEQEKRELKDANAAYETKMDTLNQEYKSRILLLDQNLEKAKQDNQMLRDKIVAAEFKAADSERTLEQIRTELVQKSNLFHTRYPAYYEVVKGDSLWHIAEKGHIYNNAFKWTELLYANRDKIEDPNVIFPGQVLKVPRYFEMVLDTFQSEWDSLVQPEEPPQKAMPAAKADSAQNQDDGWEEFF